MGDDLARSTVPVGVVVFRSAVRDLVGHRACIGRRGRRGDVRDRRQVVPVEAMSEPERDRRDEQADAPRNEGRSDGCEKELLGHCGFLDGAGIVDRPAGRAGRADAVDATCCIRMARLAQDVNRAAGSRERYAGVFRSSVVPRALARPDRSCELPHRRPPARVTLPVRVSLYATSRATSAWPPAPQRAGRVTESRSPMVSRRPPRLCAPAGSSMAEGRHARSARSSRWRSRPSRPGSRCERPIRRRRRSTARPRLVRTSRSPGLRMYGYRRPPDQSTTEALDCGCVPTAPQLHPDRRGIARAAPLARHGGG